MFFWCLSSFFLFPWFEFVPVPSQLPGIPCHRCLFPPIFLYFYSLVFFQCFLNLVYSCSSPQFLGPEVGLQFSRCEIRISVSLGPRTLCLANYHLRKVGTQSATLWGTALGRIRQPGLQVYYPGLRYNRYCPVAETRVSTPDTCTKAGALTFSFFSTFI